MRIVLILWIACLWACNQNVKGEAEISGKVLNYKSKQVYFEVCGQDSLVKTVIDSLGNFKVKLNISEGAYVRMVNGKAVFPLYLKPGSRVDMQMDAKQVQDGEYGSVVFTGGIDPETRMMMNYYQKQWFPSTEEMFMLPPVAFRSMIDSVIRFNDHIVDSFFAAVGEKYDTTFADMFKLQIKVPFAASYYYYPMYHSLMNPGDKSEVPAGFNIFDDMLPKNDSLVYNKVYRYKTYEVSYWHNMLVLELDSLVQEPAKFVSAYIDKLNGLHLNQQIRDDMGNNLIVQYAQTAPQEMIDVFKSRYKEIVVNPRYRQGIEEILFK